MNYQDLTLVQLAESIQQSREKINELAASLVQTKVKLGATNENRSIKALHLYGAE